MTGRTKIHQNIQHAGTTTTTTPVSRNIHYQTKRKKKEEKPVLQKEKWQYALLCGGGLVDQGKVKHGELVIPRQIVQQS